jgi:hypothetical protein
MPLSITLAVQVVDELTGRLVSVQLTVVVVVRGVTPVPLREMVCDPPFWLVTTAEALLAPAVVGANVTVNDVESGETPTLEAVPLESTLNCEALVPVGTPTEIWFTFPVPLFVIVTVWVLEKVVRTEPKLIVLVLTWSVGGSNWVVAERPEVSPVATTSYSPGIVTLRTN